MGEIRAFVQQVGDRFKVSLVRDLPYKADRGATPEQVVVDVLRPVTVAFVPGLYSSREEAMSVGRQWRDTLLAAYKLRQ